MKATVPESHDGRSGRRAAGAPFTAVARALDWIWAVAPARQPAAGVGMNADWVNG